jgi:hypothetical protein
MLDHTTSCLSDKNQSGMWGWVSLSLTISQEHAFLQTRIIGILSPGHSHRSFTDIQLHAYPLQVVQAHIPQELPSQSIQAVALQKHVNIIPLQSFPTWLTTQAIKLHVTDPEGCLQCS